MFPSEVQSESTPVGEIHGILTVLHYHTLESGQCGHVSAFLKKMVCASHAFSKGLFKMRVNDGRSCIIYDHKQKDKLHF